MIENIRRIFLFKPIARDFYNPKQWNISPNSHMHIPGPKLSFFLEVQVHPDPKQILLDHAKTYPTAEIKPSLHATKVIKEKKVIDNLFKFLFYFIVLHLQ